MEKGQSKIWEFYERSHKRVRCKFCRKEYRLKHSRMRYHLAGITGRGIACCLAVPPDVRGRLFQEEKDKGSRKRPRLEQHGEEGLQNAELQMVALEIGDSVDMEALFGETEYRRKCLVTRNALGGTLKSVVDKVYAGLIEKKILKFGICGLAGMGKSEAAKHIFNRFIGDSRLDVVCWVALCPDCSINKLQDLVAQNIDLDLNKIEDTSLRAVRLRNALIDKGRCIVILDNVWKYFPLDIVGIPEECSLVITSRSYKVCRAMRCENIVHCGLGDKRDEEARNIFFRELGNEVTLCTEIMEIANSIVVRCEGMPLMAISMARSMIGVTDIRRWRNSLEEMKTCKMTEGFEDVFYSLNLSHDNLKDKKLQQCLLYCAVLPSCFGLAPTEVLIEHLFVEGIIEAKSSRQAAIDEGVALLGKLQDIGLLNHSGSMHGAVRKIAFQMMKDSSFTDIGAEIKYGSCVQDPVKISWSNSEVTDITPEDLPKSTNLATLILVDNWRLERISKGVFDLFKELELLNLSNNKKLKRLPRSVGRLEKLKALFLRSCVNLREIPPLSNLLSLEVLDLQNCERVEQVPEGVKLLMKLRYLNLLMTGIVDLPSGFLAKLENLEFLAFHGVSENVAAEEIGKLCKLETLVWCFKSVQEFCSFIQLVSARKGPRRLNCYSLWVGRRPYSAPKIEDLIDMREVSINECNIDGGLFIGESMRELTIRMVKIEGKKGLCFRAATSTKLRLLFISGNDEMKFVFEIRSSPSVVRNVEKVELHFLPCLLDIFGVETDSGLVQTVPDARTFSNLKKFVFSQCPEMRKLFPRGLLANLQNLEELVVQNCKKLEEIEAAPPEQGTSYDVSLLNNQISLPKLIKIEFRKLPELKSICRAEMKCDSLEHIIINRCGKLPCVPISLPLPYLKVLEGCTESWWGSVVWGLEGQKDVFQPVFGPKDQSDSSENDDDDAESVEEESMEESAEESTEEEESKEE